MTKPTELESCVLGVVWQRGPCTAYAVRQEFLRSPSSHWTGSAGAIYPLLRRLEKEGLIRARDRAWGAGGKKEFTITARGRAALRAWIGPPLPPWTAMPTYDPVRTRLGFLALLTPAQQRTFLAEADQNLKNEIDALRVSMFDDDDRFEQLVALGAIHELEGRRRWLAEVRKALGLPVSS